MLAGDRRATMGNVIAQRDIEKVFPADEYSAVGIAGTAGLAVEMVKLFQLELEHFEKVEGTHALPGGQGEPAVHHDPRQPRHGHAGPRRGPAVRRVTTWTASKGRIFSYDVTGGRSEEHGFAADRLRLDVRPRCAEEALPRRPDGGRRPRRWCIQALYDAADDDSATGGPDVARRIYPIVTVITEDGFRRLTDEEVAEIARAILERRLEQPDGPRAALL